MAGKPQRPIPAATFGRNFGRYQDQAIAEGVVEITSNGRPIGAYISQKEYETFKAMKSNHTAKIGGHCKTS